jgi:hypothetical protein
MAILLRPNPEAFNFLDAAGIARTEANSSIIIATCQLTTDLKNYGLWNKMKAVYPFIGGTSGSHKFNLKDPQDTNGAYRLNFSGSWTHDAAGGTLDGSTTYANTYLTPSSLYSSGLYSFGAYRKNGVAVIMGSSGQYTYDWSTITAFGNNSAILTPTFSNGFKTISRDSSSTIKIAITGSVTSYSHNLNATSTTTFLLGDFLTSGGQRGSGTISFAFISDLLADSDNASLYTAVQRFQTTLGRQV